MSRIKQFLVLVAALLLITSMASAQATLTSTTLSAAVTSVSDRTIYVTTPTGFAANYLAYVDREAMVITSVSGSRINVIRGSAGTAASTHASGTTIYVGTPGYFTTYDPAGSCTATDLAVLPRVNIASGNIFDCVASLWQVINGPLTYNVGLTAIGPNALSTVDLGSALLPFRTLYATTDISFEGSSDDANETIIRITNPTADRVFTVPNVASDTFSMIGATETLVGKTLTTPVIGAATGTSLATTGNISTSAGTFLGGTAGANVGRVTLYNATSGSVSIQPTTGALGTVTATVPNQTGSINVGLVQDVILCGQLANSGTLYNSPVTGFPEGNFYAGTTVANDLSYAIGGSGCDAEDNATEGTADEPLYANNAVSVLGMVCKVSNAGANGVVLNLRSATANLTPDVTITIPTGSTTGAVNTLTTTNVAAGATFALRTITTEDLSLEDAWCIAKVQVIP